MRRVLLGFVLITLTICSPSVSALKILGILTLPSTSHHIWFMEFMKGLARSGHQIYTLSVEPAIFDEDIVTKNQSTSFVFEGMFESFQKSTGWDTKEWSEIGPIEGMNSLYRLGHEFCESQMQTQGAKRVLELVKNTKIDVIVQDLTLGQCFYALREVAQGNPPLVGFTPFGSPHWIKHIIGGNDWPAIKQHAFYYHLPPFTLWQKILNVIYHEIDGILRQYYYMPMQEKLAEKFIGTKMSTSLIDVERKIDLMLINSYAPFDAAIYLPPNAIEVGGLHVKVPKPLPQDIKAFLDGAEHGVIVMSLGTNVKTTVLGPERLKAIVTVLSQLKQRVLWKFDADDLADKPQNIMIKKWLPQGDVLTHPKVRVLWSHAGLLSTQEAIWRGVPLIGMPFFMDQYTNIDLPIKKGAGLRLDFESLTTETISETLGKILNDPSFTLRMKELSRQYIDRPLSPMDLAIWHVEHASRHPHGLLASPGRDLSRAQLNLLDVYAVFGVAALMIFWILQLLLRALFSLFRPKRKTKTA